MRSINLYLGNEVYLGDEIIELYEKHEISSINNSKYMLVELPLSGYSRNFPNILCELDNYGIIPMTVGQAETTDELVEISKRAYKKAFETVDNDKIVIVGTFPLHDVNYTNFLKIEEVKKED